MMTSTVSWLLNEWDFYQLISKIRRNAWKS